MSTFRYEVLESADVDSTDVPFVTDRATVVSSASALAKLADSIARTPTIVGVRWETLQIRAIDAPGKSFSVWSVTVIHEVPKEEL